MNRSAASLTAASLGRNYWIYATLILLSFAGSIAHVIAVTWLLLQGSDGPTYVAIAFMLSAVPSIILFRLVRRPVPPSMLTSRLSGLDAAQAVLALSIPLSVLAGHTPPRGMLLLQEFLLSCCGAFVFPLSRALLVRAAPRDTSLVANGVSASVFQVGNSVGAVGGGLLVAGLGPYVAMSVNAATYVVSAVGLAFWVRPVVADVPSGTRSTPAPHRDQAVRQPTDLIYLIMGTVALLAMQRLFLGSVGPLVDTFLSGGATLQGFLQFAFTIGGVLGGFLIGAYSRRVPTRLSISVLLAVCTVAFAAMTLASWVPLTVLASLLVGVTVSLWSVFQTDAQLLSGEEGETSTLAAIGLWQSVAALVIFGGTALASLYVEPRVSLLILALALLILGFVATTRLRGLRDPAPPATLRCLCGPGQVSDNSKE